MLPRLLPLWLLAVALAAPTGLHAQSRRRRGAPVFAVPRPMERTRARRLGLGTREAAHTLLFDRPRSSWVVAAQGRPTRRYLWPVLNGILTQDFNGQNGNHRALDIGAPCGTPIRAAHAGLVGYSEAFGNTGNIVVLIHPGGWVSAYGHTRRTLVAAGARVRRGQPIAEIGDTGDAHGCHVHFILYRDGRRLDPEPLMNGRPRASRATRP